MTKIKTILEGFLIVVIFALSFYLNTLFEKSKLAIAFKDFSCSEIKIEITLLIAGLIGFYWYLIKNIWTGFKSKILILVFSSFCLLQAIVSLMIVIWGFELKAQVWEVFNEISFPTEPDIVQKNIRFSIIRNIGQMLFSFIFIGCTGVVASIFIWFKKHKIS